MFTPHAVGVAIGLSLVSLLWAVVPEFTFLRVHEMRVSGDQVIVTRTIRREVIADWRVTVVGLTDESPSCQTVPGKKENEGWSHYKPKSKGEDVFSVDVWAWDIGCYERLTEGEYRMFVTWTPRDGTPPVTKSTGFTKP